MITRIIVSDYIKGRYNNTKLDKLEKELKRLCDNFKTREHQEYPKEGILINISMSAKFQTPFIKVSQWDRYKSVGEFENLVKEALENRGFESGDPEGFIEVEGNEEYFKIAFE